MKQQDQQPNWAWRFVVILVVAATAAYTTMLMDRMIAPDPLGITPEPNEKEHTIDSHVSPSRGTRAAVAPDTASVEEACEHTWEPAQGSPLWLVDRERWELTFAPTIETLMVQVRQVPHLAQLTDEQLRVAWETPGFPEAWALNREHMAFRQFLSGYRAREYARWEAGLPSIALETEVQPVVSFIAAFPNPDKVWSALNAYSADVINLIYESGERVQELDTVPTHWGLFGEVLEQAKAATTLVDLTLENL